MPDVPRRGDTRADVLAALGEPIATELLSACAERLRYDALEITLMNGVVETIEIGGGSSGSEPRLDM